LSTENHHERADSLVVIDFETTGMAPDYGDRAIEIGAVRIVGGEITERFQSLMNPDMRISGFIEQYTGISNRMLRSAPPGEEVMAAFADFLGEDNLVAHNASFDRRFLHAELRRIRREAVGEFACSMLTARRIYPDAPNHKLATLVAWNDLPNDGTFHRALADAQMTAWLWLDMLKTIAGVYAIDPVPLALMQQLSRVPKRAVTRFIERWRAAGG
jgi:DNA polymerase-3 subunit epsilon